MFSQHQHLRLHPQDGCKGSTGMSVSTSRPSATWRVATEQGSYLTSCHPFGRTGHYPVIEKTEGLTVRCQTSQGAGKDLPGHPVSGDSDMCACSQACSAVSNPVRPHGLQPTGSSVHGVLPARILEWAAIYSSRASSWLRDRTQSPALAYGFFLTESPGKPQSREIPWDKGKQGFFFFLSFRRIHIQRWQISWRHKRERISCDNGGRDRNVGTPWMLAKARSQGNQGRTPSSMFQRKRSPVKPDIWLLASQIVR